MEGSNGSGKLGGVFTYFQSLPDLVPRRAKNSVCGFLDDFILHNITYIFIKPFMSNVFLTTAILVTIASIAPHPWIFAFFSIFAYAHTHVVDKVIAALVWVEPAIWIDAVVLWFILSVHFFRERRRRTPRREWIAMWEVVSLGISAAVYLAPWAPVQDSSSTYDSASATPFNEYGEFQMTWSHYASLLLVLREVNGAFVESISRTKLDAQIVPKDGKYECFKRLWYCLRFWGWSVLRRATTYLCVMAAWDTVVELVVWEHPQFTKSPSSKPHPFVSSSAPSESKIQLQETLPSNLIVPKMPPAAPAPALNYTTSPSLLPYTLRFHPYNNNPSPSSSSPSQEVLHTHRLCVGAAVLSPQTTPKILLLQRSAKESALPHKWELPGGAAESLDSNSLASAARELWEETALRATKFVALVGCYQWEGAGAGEKAEAVAGDQAWGLSRGGVGIIEVGRPSDDGGIAVEEEEKKKKEEGTTAAGVEAIKDSHKFFKGRDAWRKYTYLVEVETTGAGEAEVEIDPEEHEDFVWATEEEVRADRCGERVFEWTSEHQKLDVLRAFEIARGGEVGS
ncbi:NUDIX domain-containing protein [Colletotrichum fioriniae PJ7]|uniref:NUDIX domain-containing protein n=1 Tax=Colletotrichum fioriniae PJ7 TaxID=1445577 RepID=A0A010RWW8_9PEZI|nr:NUDIX domain-containing protein [Colletotrichum fioriniae PJ7]